MAGFEQPAAVPSHSIIDASLNNDLESPQSPRASTRLHIRQWLGSPKRRALYALLAPSAIIMIFVGMYLMRSNGLASASLRSLIQDSDDRTLILYAYHETENARENALFFLRHGLHDGADFIFILNGETDLKNMIPTANHIGVIERENECYDMGAYSKVLMANDNELVKKYSKFIMLNASIRGPFLPTWSSDCWSEAFTSKVTNTNKLVGLTFNCKPVIGLRHVQSMIFATDRVGLGVLLNGVISDCYEHWEDAVHAEAGMTTAIVKAGYTVSALMTAFSSDPEYLYKCDHGDVLFNNAYYGTSIHPYEIIFQKANRNIYPEQLRLLTEWHDAAGYSSQAFCGKHRSRRTQRQLYPQVS